MKAPLDNINLPGDDAKKEDVNGLKLSAVHTLVTLKQALQFMDSNLYTQNPSSGSSIGMHTRHIIEFLQAIMLMQQQNSDVLCYDDRKRNLQLECSKESASNAIKQLIDYLLSNNFPDRKITLHALVNNDIAHVPSTLKRELLYVLDHAIHHMAMIKLIAFQFGFKLPDDFGLAYSTKKHLESSKAC